tara:strand:- start:1507 stop:1644 length:138 start_codon:yes stop_codon:yes gene_type:complete
MRYVSALTEGEKITIKQMMAKIRLMVDVKIRGLNTLDFLLTGINT